MTPTSRLRRCATLRVLLLVLVVATVLSGCRTNASLQPSSGPPPAGAGVAPGSAAPQGRALALLAEWDRRRAEAYAASDADALAELYAPGSSAGPADLATLAAYQDRGVRLRDLAMQRFAVTVVREEPGTMGVRVTERLARVVAQTRRGRALLPAGPVRTRTITFERRSGSWVVTEVR